MTATFGPYETEQETYDSPLARAVQAALPGRGLGATVNREHLAAAIENAGIRLGGYDVRILNWLSKYEASTVQVVIGLISRAHAAGRSKARYSGDDLASVAGLVERWRTDPASFPEGTTAIFDAIIEMLAGGEQS